MSEITLGSKVKDKITGFSGIAFGRTTWLTGCARIGIRPDRLDKDGKPFDIEWFDEPQVEVIHEEPAKSEPRTGGPQADPRW